jgi:glucose-1-phosphate adenylyltransferase
MNYAQLLDYHHSKKSDLTISAVRVRKQEAAGRLGVLAVDQDFRLIGFEEKPAEPKTLPIAPDYALGSMGVYIFKVKTLIKALEGREDDFGREIIPKMLGQPDDIFVYDYEKENKIQDFLIEVKEGRRRKILVDQTRDSGYWKDVGSIDSYYEASMDLVGIDPVFNLYGERWPIRTYPRPLPPSKCVLGGRTPESMVSDGCIISGGTVWNSVLSPGVVVERDSLVEQSIIFDDVIIEPNARIRRAIIDKEVTIRANASVGLDRDADKARGCIISEGGVVVVPKGADIGRAEPSLF